MNILLILLPEGDKRDQHLYPMVQLRTDRQAGLTFRGHSLFMRENKIPGEGEAIFPPLLQTRTPEPRVHSRSIPKLRLLPLKQQLLKGTTLKWMHRGCSCGDQPSPASPPPVKQTQIKEEINKIQCLTTSRAPGALAAGP